ncbi:SusC/RagA family TonB-linked outer membrane protein [Gabonibacter chumensis]|uniref:SusC/RagA family TonB-linked outer membrane protein n=1 Tax=Gabonibacter chumensis TaxID=2972474 RepID=UPI002573DE5E|nr:SusC/RagA family TonB-linked outer membrane protein [Gabonibacter chumensis]MCR9011542.1 SusC/RagA family TonB-linked outer membrane protein [Gabonibacter chumensis]
MKLTSILLFVSFMPLSAALYSQNTKISLLVKESSLEKVFKLIEQQSDYLFVYNHEQVENNKRITVDIKDMEIKQVLDICLKDTGLYYELIDNTVIIQKRQKDEKKTVSIRGKVTDRDSIPLPGVTVRLKGTTIGTATDTKGEFKLQIPNDTSKIVLLFTFIGMKSVEKEAKEGKSIHVIMEEEAATLSEVVSYGYYNVDKRHLTSAVTSIKAADIAVPGINTIDQMLEGHVPGMIFIRNSGQVGAAPKVKIRGTTTILGSTAPLWVLDGVILTDPVNVDPASINDLDFVNLLGNAISGLNPDDVEQIDVLKDASATAIYGPRASNGVIVITTKKGKVGKPSISYSVSGTYRLRPRYTDRSVNVMNSQERIAYSRELIDAQLAIPDLKSWVGYESAYYDYCNKVITHEEFTNAVRAMETANTDWLGLLMQDTYSHNHTLSISGGTEHIRYYASLGYMDESGNIRGEQNKRYSSMVNLNLDYNRFSMRFGLKANLQKKEYTPKEVGLTDYAYNTSRSISAYNQDGSLLYYQRLNDDSNVNDELPFNIINEYKNSSDNIDTDQIGINLSFGYKIIPSLKAEVVFAYNVSHTNEEIFFGENSWYISNLRRKNRESGEISNNSLCPVGGELQISNTKNDNYSLRASLNFNKILDENQHHLLSASVIGELSSSEYRGFRITRRGYLPKRGMIFDAIDIEGSKYPDYKKWLMSGSALGRLSNNLTNLVGLIGSVTYSYDNTYILNANMRIDASNKFGDASNDRLLPIWSVSGRWNMHENILRDVDWLNLLALKMSFGYQGNMSAQDSPRLIIQRQGTNSMFNEFYSLIDRYPNPNLKWEKTSTYNIDLEFSLFQNKVRGSVGYYYRNTTDAFLAKKVSNVNGIENHTVNAGHLRNQGFEFSFNFTPINTMSASGNRKGFIWRFDPNFGSVINQLVDKIKPKDKLIQDEITYSNYLDGSVQIAGRPLNTFYSYKFKGLNPKNGAPMFHDTDEFVSEDGKDIDMKEVYSSMEKEEVYTTVMKRSGCREPFLQGGISNYLGWRNLGLSFNLAYSFGSKIRLFKMYSSGGNIVGPERNLRKEFTKRWQRPGDEAHTNIPGILPQAEWSKTLYPWWSNESYKFASNIWNMYDNSDLRVVSGNYMRLQSASLRYIIPDEFCKKLNLKSAYVSISGTDLFTLCSRKLKGQDPSQSGTSELINMSVRPTYSLQLNVTF